jgi:hypothetical protein
MEPNVGFTRPFLVLGSGWRARSGYPWGDPASDHRVLALWLAFLPSAAARKGHVERGRVSTFLPRAGAPTADGDQRSMTGPDVVERRRRRPATSSDRLARGIAPVASSSRDSACRSAGCAPDRSVAHRPATGRRGPASHPDHATRATAPAACAFGAASGSPRRGQPSRARWGASSECCDPGGRDAWDAAPPRRAHARSRTACRRRGARHLVRARLRDRRR